MIKLIVVLTLAVHTLTADYCQTVNTSPRVFLTQNEVRTIPLPSFIQGHDLKFSIDVPSVAKVYSSFQITNSHPMNLGGYTKLKSVDVRKEKSYVGMGIAAFLAQKDNNQEVAIWVGEFQGYTELPSIDKYRYFTLPDGLSANCFNLRVLNDKLEVILNCQTIPVAGQIQLDLFCYIKTDDNKLSLQSNCRTISSLSTSLSRQSKLLNLGSKSFLLSSNKDLSSEGQILSYIAVYYINSNNDVVFNNIIDGSALENPSFQISDFIIATDNTIVVADVSSNRLVLFDYSIFNELSVKKVKNLNEKPLSLAYDPTKNTLLVATRTGITEYKASDAAIAKYQVDPTDASITSLKVSTNLVAFSTKNKNLYVYERSQFKMNYLLTKQDIGSETHFLLGQESSYLFTFNARVGQSVSVKQPYLQLSNIAKNEEVKVTAKSQNQICEVQLRIGFVKDTQQIVNKDDLSQKSFKVDPLDGLSLKLDDYYGGVNLKYELDQTAQNDDFDISFKQIQDYVFTPSFAPTEASIILAISDSSYYYVGINTIKESQVYIDICSLTKDTIKCQLQSKVILFQKKNPIQFLTARTRSDGNSIVGWTYKNAQFAQWLNLKGKPPSAIISGSNYAHSSMIIADFGIILLSKTQRKITINFELDGKPVKIDDQMFTNDQLTELQYFYPRQIYLQETTDRILFVKLPTKIAKFALLANQQVKYLGIVKALKGYVPANQWSVSSNGQSMITLLEGAITEEYYNPTQSQFITLQTVDNISAPAPVIYDSYSGLLALISAPEQNGERTVKFMKPNQGSMGLQYAEITVNGRTSFSGNWLLVDGLSPAIYFVSSSAILSVQTNLPEQIFKQDLSVPISVKSKTKSEQSKTEIQAVNYPISVKDISNEDTLKMPYTADNLEIQVPVQSYFNGSIVQYILDCPFCDGDQISLLPPVRESQRIKGIAATDFVAVADNILVLSNNNLILVNNQIEEITRMTITDQVSCTNLEFNKATDLLVFCSGETGQQILNYQIAQDAISYKGKSVLQGTSAIRHFDEMFVYSNKDGIFLVILDNDEYINSNNKRSTLKVYEVKDDLVYLAEWTSKSFGALEVLPINDFTMIGSQILVTLGNYGIGYGTFTGKAVLTDVNNLKLAAEPGLKEILVDDSYFKQISVLSFDHQTSQLKVFISSTTSLSMVIVLSLTGDAYKFSSLKETYYRYGGQRLLNWHAVTASNIFLSFYNDKSEEVTVVSYNRVEGKRNQFVSGVPVKLPKSLLQYHQAFVTTNNQLLVSHVSDLSQDDELICLNITGRFSFMLNYTQPGVFTNVSIQGLNSYRQAVHTQKVQFEKPIPPPPPPGPDDGSGLKWYLIVIIIAASLIVIGTAYGLFRYKKNKRAEKSVSLLTEKEEGQEEREAPMKEEIQTMGGQTMVVDRSSINRD